MTCCDRTRIALGVLSTLLLVSWCLHAHAATYYVSAGGHGESSVSDSNSCTTAQTITTPKRNLATANGGLSCLHGAGDTLYIRGGTYTEWLTNGTYAQGGGTDYSDVRPGGSVVWIGAYTPDGGSTYESVLITFDVGAVVLSMNHPDNDHQTLNYLVWDHLHIHQSRPIASTIGSGNSTQIFQNGEVTHDNWPPNPGDPTYGTPCAGGSVENGNGILVTAQARNELSVAPGAIFRNNYFHDEKCTYAFYIQVAQSNQYGPIIEGNRFERFGWYAIQFYMFNDDAHVPLYYINAIVRNNTFSQCGQGGFPDTSGVFHANPSGCLVMYKCRNCEVYNNTFTDSSDGIVIKGHTESVKVYNNTFYNTNTSAFSTHTMIQVEPDVGIADVRNNVGYLAGTHMLGDGFGTYDTLPNVTQSNNSFGVNPQFVNVSSTPPNLRLTASTPTTIKDGGTPVSTSTVGYGIPATSVSKDKDGTNRPVNGVWDLGAYEFGTSGPDTTPTSLRFVSQPQTAVVNATIPLGTVQVTDSSGTLSTGYTQNITVSLVGGSPTIPKTGWTIPFVDSFEPSASQGGLDYSGIRAIDGNINLVWVTQYNGGSPPYPHELQIDMQQVVSNVSGFQYLPNQALSAGRIAQFEIYTSTTGGGACNTWSLAATGTWPDTAVQKEVTFTSARSARYVCLRGLSAVDGGPYAGAAEVNVLQGSAGGTGTLHGTLVKAAVGGQVNFTDLSIDAAGVYQLQVSGPTLTAQTSNQFTITPPPGGSPTKLNFLIQPSTPTPVNTVITPTFSVQVQDASNNPVSTDSGRPITLTLSVNPGGASIAGTNPVNTAGGAAQFSNISLTQPGVGYMFQAASPGLTPATSNLFTITPPAATKLVYVTQPSSVGVNQTLPAVNVQAQDVANTSATFTGNLTLAILTGPNSSALHGTVVKAYTFGGIGYTDLTFDTPGVYTLQVSGAGLAPQTSIPVTITGAPIGGTDPATLLHYIPGR